MVSASGNNKMRVGIAGLDHWYAGLGAARAVAADPDVDLVVVAHRDEARARETARRFGAAEWTTQYDAVVQRDDLDIVVTACRTSENADLCMQAAARGLHIFSVKPIAMTRDEAARIKEAVDRSGVRFLSAESDRRLNRQYQLIKEWIDEGRIGRPISVAQQWRAPLPTQEWPGVTGRTWWLNPAYTPCGGWMDHAIYTVDMLRWLFDSEVVAASGLVANLVHKDLASGLEDFGSALLTFGGGQVASVEVTWTAARGASIATTHIVGSEGALLLDSQMPGRATVSGHFEPFSGWSSVTLPEVESIVAGSTFSQFVAAVREGAPLPAGVDDACRNLDACFTFYEAARSGGTGQVAPA